MNDLAKLTIDAHGGLERWQQLAQASAHLQTGGVLWTLKGQAGTIAEVDVRVALQHEWASHSAFNAAGLRTSFAPHRVALETHDGRVLDERLAPRESFAGHQIDTPWDRLHLAYFAGYAMWTYLTVPFVFATKDVVTEELAPWHERGERWRRLRVTFPAAIATHSTVQEFYVGANGLLTRHDYAVEVIGGSPAAHYVYDYREFSGVMVPTRREVFPRQPDGRPAPDPLLVSIRLSDVEFA